MNISPPNWQVPTQVFFFVLPPQQIQEDSLHSLSPSRLEESKWGKAEVSQSTCEFSALQKILVNSFLQIYILF